MLKYAKICFALPLLLFTFAVDSAQAETPPCTCSISSSILSLDGGLDCFVVYEDSLDACYGDDIVIRVNNSCTFDVTIQDLRDFDNPDGAERIIPAGSEDAWQEAFSPVLNFEGDTSVHMEWVLAAEDTTYTLELDFVGACTESESALGGCESGTSNLPLWLATLLLAVACLQRLRTSRGIAQGS